MKCFPYNKDTGLQACLFSAVKIMKKRILFLAMSLLISGAVIARTTTIWIVRHAEKDKTNPENPNPDLSPEGKKRAQDLATYLKEVRFDAAYSTPLKRTHQTLEPLVTRNKISVADYNDVKTLIADLKQNHPGRNIIIAGHTNTVLETIEALGGQRPVNALSEEDFDYIFKVTLEGNKPEVHMSTYGTPHHGEKK
jgi:phosphohistidine phosphatase SixA